MPSGLCDCAGSLEMYSAPLCIRSFRHRQERRDRCFDVGVKHFNFVSDPATHSKKELLVGVVWSWEQDLAGIGDVQQLLPGNAVLLEEEDLSDQLGQLALRRKLERVATYRQLQAVSNSLATSTRGRVTLESFLLPNDVHVRRVDKHETWVGQVREGWC